MQTPKRKPGKYSDFATDHVMSQKKYNELEQELEKLKAKRPHAASEVTRLAELGDFSENVEYQLAKRRLRGINYGITKIEFQLNHADVVKGKTSGRVGVGSVVTIETPRGEREYTILGASEADPAHGVISHGSPLGSALMGAQVGDEIEVEKVGECKIINIS